MFSERHAVHDLQSSCRQLYRSVKSTRKRSQRAESWTEALLCPKLIAFFRISYWCFIAPQGAHLSWRSSGATATYLMAKALCFYECVEPEWSCSNKHNDMARISAPVEKWFTSLHNKRLRLSTPPPIGGFTTFTSKFLARNSRNRCPTHNFLLVTEKHQKSPHNFDTTPRNISFS